MPSCVLPSPVGGLLLSQERAYYNLERLWEDGSNRLPLPFDQTAEE